MLVEPFGQLAHRQHLVRLHEDVEHEPGHPLARLEHSERRMRDHDPAALPVRQRESAVAHTDERDEARREKSPRIRRVEEVRVGRVAPQLGGRGRILARRFSVIAR